jgi:hypothetical protein
MEQLARNDDTPAGKIATERLIAATLDPDRYPDGTAFVPADADDVQAMLTANFKEGRPVALVYPDGREVVATPQTVAAVWFLMSLVRALVDLVRGRRSREDGSASETIEVPRNYRVEIRRTKAAA